MQSIVRFANLPDASTRYAFLDWLSAQRRYALGAGIVALVVAVTLLERGVIQHGGSEDALIANVFTWAVLMALLGYGRRYLSFATLANSLWHEADRHAKGHRYRAAAKQLSSEQILHNPLPSHRGRSQPTGASAGDLPLAHHGVNPTLSTYHVLRPRPVWS
jgi:hypothetical protein